MLNRIKVNNSLVSSDIVQSFGNYSSDFAIADENGNAIITFKDGELEVKGFVKIIDYDNLDFGVSDEMGNVLYLFRNGQFITKYISTTSISYRD